MPATNIWLHSALTYRIIISVHPCGVLFVLSASGIAASCFETSEFPALLLTLKPAHLQTVDCCPQFRAPRATPWPVQLAFDLPDILYTSDLATPRPFPLVTKAGGSRPQDCQTRVIDRIRGLQPSLLVLPSRGLTQSRSQLRPLLFHGCAHHSPAATGWAS